MDGAWGVLKRGVADVQAMQCGFSSAYWLWYIDVRIKKWEVISG